MLFKTFQILVKKKKKIFQEVKNFLSKKNNNHSPKYKDISFIFKLGFL
jgi:hypothetical protein